MIGKHSQNLNDMYFYKFVTDDSYTFTIYGFCLLNPIKPNFIAYTPANFASQIHFCKLQLFDKYYWNTKVP